MDIQDYIRQELWNSISNTFDTGNYREAIISSIQYLTTLIREKSGLDGDGQTLVNGSFGGENPKVKINMFQTDSEISTQKGYLNLLDGIYMAIRNPRSHNLLSDTREDAEAIIIFINYLVGIIEKSSTAFSVEGFLSKVRDQYFVLSDRYAELLVNDIPQGKLYDTLIWLYRCLEESYLEPFKVIIEKILLKVDDVKKEQFLKVISEQLMEYEFPHDCYLIIKVLPSDLWPKIKEASRIRVESMLIKGLYHQGLDYSGRASEVIQPEAGLILRIFDYF